MMGILITEVLQLNCKWLMEVSANGQGEKNGFSSFSFLHDLSFCIFIMSSLC